MAEVLLREGERLDELQRNGYKTVSYTHLYRHLVLEGLLCDNYRYVIILSESLLPMHKAL